MSHSFTPAFRTESFSHPSPTDTADNPRHVLVTGAAGRIGKYFAEHSHERYRLRLMIQEGVTPEDERRFLEDFGEVVVGQLEDRAKLQEHCKGIDTVVHLAADPSPVAGWDSLLPNNIVGTYNMMTAARDAGVRRLVYASSIHAVSGYPKDIQVKPGEAVNPGDLYGVTKCFGEALGRFYAEQHGLSVIAIRIGAFQPVSVAERKEKVKLMDAFVSHRDLNQLLQRAIDDRNLQFAIVQGLSNNRFKRMDISNACELLGYTPQDDFTELSDELRDLGLSTQVQQHAGRE